MRSITFLAATLTLFMASPGFAQSRSEAAAAESGKDSDLDEVHFRIPSTLSLSASQSSSEAKSGSIAARLMWPKNFWTEFSADRSIEVTDGLETKTLGLSATAGTDPLQDYSLDIGGDTFGVDNQYSVREARVRVTAMPFSVFGFENPGIELAAEYRRGEFQFTNTPNSIFTTNQVSLGVDTYRFEIGFFMLAPWTVRFHTERAQLASGFLDLNRPLAPLFIPEAAISTAVSWPGEENGLSVSYGGRKWGARIGGARKKAAVTEDKTVTVTVAADYRWTRKISTGLRYTQSKSEDDSTLEPIQTVGMDVGFSF